MKKNPESIQIFLVPTWEILKNIEEKIASYFNESKENLRASTNMVVNELIENAIKYGKSIPGKNGIEFKFSIINNEIFISVSNLIIREQDYFNIKESIDKLKNRDKKKFYVDRLKKLLENTLNFGSQLGLIRVAYEGKFELDYTFKDDILTVTAKRDI